MVVLAPLGAVGWLGLEVSRGERRRVERRVEGLMRATLETIDERIATVLERHAAGIRRELSSVVPEPDALRDAARRLPAVREVFVVDAATGDLLHPPILGDLTPSEQAFLDRTRELWLGDAVGRAPGPESPPLGSPSGPAGPRSGWSTWYRGPGIQLAYWFGDASGLIRGAELDRTRLLAELVGELPDTDPRGGDLPGGRIRLVGARGDVLYQWGRSVGDPGDAPRATLAVSDPLGAWSLEYLGGDAPYDAALGTGLLVNLGAGLGGLAVVVVGLGLYVYRESSREIREAGKRVTFVNQVSHELRTPLTNIRMYAEMLEEELPDEDEASRGRLAVITAESRRLSRLIDNILTFASARRQDRPLRLAPGSVDAIVGAVVDSFRPGLSESGIEVELDLRCPGPVRVDADAVGQMLGNLVSNVEKYAATGDLLRIRTSTEGDEVVLAVEDRGPGVPRAERERIFEAFHRGSSELTEGVAGAGIGLAIARELARKHGGDLILVGDGPGARFELRLRCPPAEGPS